MIVGRNTYVRHGLIVPPKSVIGRVDDLRGKTVGVSFGTSAERFLLLKMKAAGLTTNDLNLINIGAEEQGEIVRRGTEQSLEGNIRRDRQLGTDAEHPGIQTSRTRRRGRTKPHLNGHVKRIDR